MEHKIRIVLADDDGIIREGLKMILDTQADMELVGSAVDGKQAIELCRELNPDVVMLDIRMPVMNGIEAAEMILQEKIGAPLLLTTFDEEDFVLRALKVGVSGYILKNSPSERILHAIRTVHVGGTVFGPDILEYIRDKVQEGPDKTIFHLLSDREMEVVKLVAEGLSNQEIADRLFLSNGTVRNHISTILEKTGLEHRTQIAVKYLTR